MHTYINIYKHTYTHTYITYIYSLKGVSLHVYPLQTIFGLFSLTHFREQGKVMFDDFKIQTYYI